MTPTQRDIYFTFEKLIDSLDDRVTLSERMDKVTPRDITVISKAMEEIKPLIPDIRKINGTEVLINRLVEITHRFVTLCAQQAMRQLNDTDFTA